MKYRDIIIKAIPELNRNYCSLRPDDTKIELSEEIFDYEGTKTYRVDLKYGDEYITTKSFLAKYKDTHLEQVYSDIFDDIFARGIFAKEGGLIDKSRKVREAYKQMRDNVG